MNEETKQKEKLIDEKLTSANVTLDSKTGKIKLTD